VIINQAELLSHGNVRDREVVLEILAAGLSAPDPYANTGKMVRIDVDKLFVGLPEFSLPRGEAPLEFDLKKINNIFIVGGGKSIQPIAKALEDVLGELITDGHICIKKGDDVTLSRIGYTLAGHPSPDRDSVSGAQRILEIERRAKEGDIVFWCNSGGGTSLMALPAEGLTLEDLLAVNRLLYFEHGASMGEINALRFPMTNLRGKHAKHVRGATLIKIDVDEQPIKGRDCGYSSLRTAYPDPYDHAFAVLDKYNCRDKIPESVRIFLEKRNPKYTQPTPAELGQRPYYEYRVSGPEQMLEAAKSKARSMGVDATIFATSLNDLEVRPVAESLAQMAKEAEVLGQPLEPPCVLSGYRPAPRTGASQYKPPPPRSGRYDRHQARRQRSRFKNHLCKRQG
jgi:glycerate-2-kinase